MLSEAKKNDEFYILYVQIHIYIYIYIVFCFSFHGSRKLEKRDLTTED